MAQLYDVEVPTIKYHLKEVFEDSELEEQAVIRNLRITAVDGKTCASAPQERRAARGSRWDQSALVDVGEEGARDRS
jgi:hypothetical protein